MWLVEISLLISCCAFIAVFCDFDSITQGRFNKKKDSFQLIYTSMLDDLDNWKIDVDFARFPKTGNSEIYIRKQNHRLIITMTGRSTEEVVTGHYRNKILHLMESQNNKQELNYLNRTLFEGDIMKYIEDRRTK